jgi:hypothetical protein
MKPIKLFLFAGLLIAAMAATAMLRATSAAAPRTIGLLVTELSCSRIRRVERSEDNFRSAPGKTQMAAFRELAIIHNPSFDPKYDAQFSITCLQVVGNRASFGGSVRKTSDPVFNDEFDAAFFTVFDNGEPGAGN